MPYNLFIALRQGNSDELFRSDKNMDEYRYLPQKKTFFSPDSLPVGFTKMITGAKTTLATPARPAAPDKSTIKATH